MIAQLFDDDGIPDQVGMQLFHVGPMEANIAYTIAPHLELPTLEEGEEASKDALERAGETVSQYLAAWASTDAALLHRLGRECWLNRNEVLSDSLQQGTAVLVDSPRVLESAPVTFDPVRAEHEIVAMA